MLNTELTSSLIVLQFVPESLYLGKAAGVCPENRFQLHALSNIGPPGTQGVAQGLLIRQLPAECEFKSGLQVMAVKAIRKHAQVDQRVGISQMQGTSPVGQQCRLLQAQQQVPEAAFPGTVGAKDDG